MRTLPRLFLVAGCFMATTAQAQMAGPAQPGSPGSRHGRQPEAEATPGKPAASGMKIPPEIWPRLDRGATVCDSLDALKSRAALLANGGRPPMPPGCRPVVDTIKVTVLDRDPPAATQVRVDSTREVAWTDAWLPEKPPFVPGQSSPRPPTPAH